MLKLKAKNLLFFFIVEEKILLYPCLSIFVFDGIIDIGFKIIVKIRVIVSA